MKDRYGRTIDYMRISITDRCNLRCCYCMPDGIQAALAQEILTYEEIEVICRAAARAGISRLKVTGGEPLVRADCAQLTGMLKQIPGIQQVTMTTNGILLDKYLPQLLENGLDAVNISLDTLSEKCYGQITGRAELPRVLANIRQAVQAGIKVKINCVLMKNRNSREWLNLAELTKELQADVRFIEMMPIGCGKDFEPVYNEKILNRLYERYPNLEKDDSVHGNGPAVYYRIKGAKGSIGFISAMHGKFCGSCNRIRLTSDGKLKPCLCYADSVDLKKILRRGTQPFADRRCSGGVERGMEEAWQEEALQEETWKGEALREEAWQEDALQIEDELYRAFRQAVQQKPGMHRFEGLDGVTEKGRMVQIGG